MADTPVDKLALDTPQMRARRIVKLAAGKTKVTYLRDWFIRDEHGIWEKEALRLLDWSATRASQLQLTDEQVDDQTAVQLVLNGLTALENYLRKKG